MTTTVRPPQTGERRKIWYGGEALAEAALRSGCKFACGYPISPGTEIMEYLAQQLPQRGGVFIHCETELAGINYLKGASATGARCMINSSSLGISLMLEGISYMVQAEEPALIVNMSRGGPGNGVIGPSQADYFQATKSGPHGGCRVIVLGPSTVQEMVNHVQLSFHLADKWRTPVILLGDTILAQSSEAIAFPPPINEPLPPKDWAVGDGKPRLHHLSTGPGAPGGTGGQGLEQSEAAYRRLYEKWLHIEKQEVRWEAVRVEDADVCVVAFGTAARIAKTAVAEAREAGIKAGLLRPITLWPYPYAPIREAAQHVKKFLVVELNWGQMVEDVQLAVQGKRPVEFYGRAGGMYPLPHEITEQISRLAR